MDATSESAMEVDVNLRIPGGWSEQQEFVERLPSDVRLLGNKLVLPDGAAFEINALEADDQFPGVFASACSKLPTEEERGRIENYTVNVCLSGRCGNLATARQMLAAGAAVIRAGGAGVFVDNSALSHGATDWITLHESADNGGVYWAFVGTSQSRNNEVFSTGMHILGFRDAILPATGNDEYDYRTLHSFLGFTAFSGMKLNDGEIVGDTILPTFRVHKEPHDRFPKDGPLFNPFGQWRLERMETEQN